MTHQRRKHPRGGASENSPNFRPGKVKRHGAPFAGVCKRMILGRIGDRLGEAKRESGCFGDAAATSFDHTLFTNAQHNATFRSGTQLLAMF